jgi:hypothetical protein
MANGELEGSQSRVELESIDAEYGVGKKVQVG